MNLLLLLHFLSELVFVVGVKIRAENASIFLSPGSKAPVTFICSVENSDSETEEPDVFVRWTLRPSFFDENVTRGDLTGSSGKLAKENGGYKYALPDVNPERAAGDYWCDVEGKNSSWKPLFAAPFVPTRYLSAQDKPRPHLKEDSKRDYTQASVTATETYDAVLSCPIYGYPNTLRITWSLQQDGKFQSLSAEDMKKKGMVLENNHRVLKFNGVQSEHAGVYKCEGKSDFQVGGKSVEEAASIQTQLRVKGKLAALWPSLGIIAEVILLGAVIWFFEWKQNKEEAASTAVEPDDAGDDDD